MLKLNTLALRCEEPTHWKKYPDTGKDWRQKEKGQPRMRRFNSITDSMDMHLGELRETVWDREVWQAAIHRVPKSQPRHSDWTTTTTYKPNSNRVAEFIQPADSQKTATTYKPNHNRVNSFNPLIPKDKNWLCIYSSQNSWGQLHSRTHQFL